jgi:hypothetical protein
MSRGRKQKGPRRGKPRKKTLEYSMCGDTLLLRCDEGGFTRVTAIMPEWLLVSIGDVAVELEGGRVVIRDIERNKILYEGDTRWS